MLLLLPNLSSAALAGRPRTNKSSRRVKSSDNSGTSRKGDGGRGFARAPLSPPASAPLPLRSARAVSSDAGMIRPPTERERSFLNASPHNTGMSLLATGQYEDAGLAFEKALAIDPDAVETWSALGVCMAELGQTEAALVCQRQVQRLRGILLNGSDERAQEEEAEALASSTSLPPLPDGRVLTINTGSLADCDTGGRLWSSAHVLCRFQERMVEQVRGSAVLELGCGTGGVGLFAAALGARNVVLTDGGPEAVLRLAQANVDANQGLWISDESTTAVEVWPLAWGASAAEPLASAILNGRFDWLLGSDVTYSMGAHGPLCATIKGVLTTSEGGCRAILAHEHRVANAATHDERLAHLIKQAAAAGLRVATLSTEHEGKRRVSLLEVQLL